MTHRIGNALAASSLLEQPVDGVSGTMRLAALAPGSDA